MEKEACFRKLHFKWVKMEVRFASAVIEFKTHVGPIIYLFELSIASVLKLAKKVAVRRWTCQFHHVIDPSYPPNQ